MASYLPFRKEAPKRLVLRSNMIVATTAFVKDAVDEETGDSADDILALAIVPTEVVDDALEKLEYVENNIGVNPSKSRHKKKSRITLLFFLFSWS